MAAQEDWVQKCLSTENIAFVWHVYYELWTYQIFAKIKQL